MIPVLENIVQLDDLTVWQTSDNKIGTGFKIEPCDVEDPIDPAEYFERLTKFIRSLDPDVIARIQLKSENCFHIDNKAYRSTAIENLRYCKRTVFLFVQVNGEPEIIYRFKKLLKAEYKSIEFDSILKVRDLIKSSGLFSASLTEVEIKNLFIEQNEKWTKDQTYISNGKELIGMVRLNKPKASDISIDEVRGRWHGIARIDCFILEDGSINFWEMNSVTPSGEAETGILNQVLHHFHPTLFNPTRRI